MYEKFPIINLLLFIILHWICFQNKVFLIENLVDKIVFLTNCNKYYIWTSFTANGSKTPPKIMAFTRRKFLLAPLPFNFISGCVYQNPKPEVKNMVINRSIFRDGSLNA